jgi:hypothetical protein
VGPFIPPGHVALSWRADSSQNTMAARRRRALRRILGPVLGHPTGDGLLVALDGAAGGALEAVVQPVAQQLPDVAGMVGHPGQPLDHGPDAGQGPVVAVEAVGAGALAQRLVDTVQLLVRQARGLSGRAGATERLQPALAPLGVPAADILPGHAEGAGDLGLGVADGKQRPGLQADGFERLAVTQTTGVAAIGGWSHTAMLPGQPPIMSSEGANLFNLTHLPLQPATRSTQHTLHLTPYASSRPACTGWQPPRRSTLDP